MKDRKKFWGTVTFWLVILESIFIIWACIAASNLLIYNLFIINLLCGPLCIIFYFIEVKKGVFRDDEQHEGEQGL